MITNFIFEKNGSFNINGTIDFADINFETQSTTQLGVFYKDAIVKMLNIKKTIIKCLSNDAKIIGNERIDVIKSIDNFLTLLFAVGLLNSNTPLLFMCEIKDYFSLSVQSSKTKVFKATGNINNVSSKDMDNYHEWIDSNILNLFKEIITLTNNLESNKEDFLKKLSHLIFNSIVLRYKIEYV